MRKMRLVLVLVPVLSWLFSEPDHQKSLEKGLGPLPYEIPRPFDLLPCRPPTASCFMHHVNFFQGCALYGYSR